VQTRFIVTCGFLLLGCSLLYSRGLAPDIDFTHLMMMRVTQSFGIGFLFVPVSVLAYQTVPHRLQGDATALFTMFRNVFGSIGISVSTAAITSRTQAHMAYLSGHLSAGSPNFRSTVTAIAREVQNLGTTAAQSTQIAMGRAYQALIAQAGFLAYKDVFLYCALLAFAFIPFTFFFSPVKKAGRPGPGAH
jgi:DHA2 family multidrug resistance protein